LHTKRNENPVVGKGRLVSARSFKVKIEIPVDGYDTEPWNGISDYTLCRENGEVLAVVEAKKTSVDVRGGEAGAVVSLSNHQRVV
jgi:type I site-specific restriction endonuclease